MADVEDFAWGLVYTNAMTLGKQVALCRTSQVPPADSLLGRKHVAQAIL